LLFYRKEIVKTSLPKKEDFSLRSKRQGDSETPSRTK